MLSDKRRLIKFKYNKSLACLSSRKEQREKINNARQTREANNKHSSRMKLIIFYIKLLLLLLDLTT